MKILNGKKTAEDIILNLETEIAELLTQGNRVPRLDIIIVGNDFASEKYVSMKEKRATEIGIKTVIHRFEGNCKVEEIKNLIKKLNKDTLVDGIMAQLPLPENFKEDEIVELIDISKDVDGLTYTNLGRLWKEGGVGSATPTGIIKLLDSYDIEIGGKDVVVIGRSKVVGLPLSAMFLSRNATVTICHSKTENLKEKTKKADIVVAAIGKPKMITKEYVKKGVVVVDVGTNRDYDGKLVGDVDFDSVSKIASYITPVPGGVGPMTIASLLSNLIEIYRKNVKKY